MKTKVNYINPLHKPFNKNGVIVRFRILLDKIFPYAIFKVDYVKNQSIKTELDRLLKEGESEYGNSYAYFPSKKAFQQAHKTGVFAPKRSIYIGRPIIDRFLKSE